MRAVDMGGGIWASGGRSLAGVRGFVVFLVIVTNVDVGVGVVVGIGVSVVGEKMGLGIWICGLWFVARLR